MASKATIKALTTVSLCSGIAESVKDVYKAKAQIKNAEDVQAISAECMELWKDTLTEKQLYKLGNDLQYLEAVIGKDGHVSILTSVGLALLSDLFKKVNDDKKNLLNRLISAMKKMHEYSDRSLARTKEYMQAEKAVITLQRRLDA